nr:flagellin [uncultured Dysosmobacter sp.]
MRIQNNIMAMNAYRNYSNNTSALSKNLEKLSSGYKINRAGDDAAGLAISEKMRAQITGLEGAQSNAKDGVSLVQTAEGALTEVHDMLNRMYSLAEQSANGTYENETDRAQLQKEVTELKSEINRIADSSNFNGINLLDGSMERAGADGGVGLVLTSGAGAIDFKQTSSGATNASATFDLDLSKLSFDTLTTDSTFTLRINGKDYDVNVTAGVTDATGLAKAVATELTGKVPDGRGAKFTVAAAAAGKLTFTAGAQGVLSQKDAGLTTARAVGGKSLSLQIGDTSDDFNQLSVSIKDCHTDSLGIADIDIGTQEGAKAALDTIESAINYVSDVRGTLGATQNRLDHTMNNLSVMQENIQDAESTIRDTDVAEEMMSYTKNNILVQSAQAMLAQANQVPQGVLQLLQ